MKTTISVSVDKAAKDSAKAIAKSAGLSLSTLVNAYLLKVSATRQIELYAPEQITPKLEKLIAKAEAEIAAGEVSGPFDNVEDFLADLKK